MLESLTSSSLFMYFNLYVSFSVPLPLSRVMHGTSRFMAHSDSTLSSPSPDIPSGADTCTEEGPRGPRGPAQEGFPWASKSSDVWAKALFHPCIGRMDKLCHRGDWISCPILFLHLLEIIFSFKNILFTYWLGQIGSNKTNPNSKWYSWHRAAGCRTEARLSASGFSSSIVVVVLPSRGLNYR